MLRAASLSKLGVIDQGLYGEDETNDSVEVSATSKPVDSRLSIALQRRRQRQRDMAELLWTIAAEETSKQTGSKGVNFRSFYRYLVVLLEKQLLETGYLELMTLSEMEGRLMLLI